MTYVHSLGDNAISLSYTALLSYAFFLSFSCVISFTDVVQVITMCYLKILLFHLHPRSFRELILKFRTYKALSGPKTFVRSFSDILDFLWNSKFKRIHSTCIKRYFFRFKIDILSKFDMSQYVF